MTATVAAPALLAPGSELAPGYRVVELLNRGQALDVYEVYSERHWCHCVAKTPRPDRPEERVRERLLNEGRLLARIGHPHLVRGIETIEEPRPVVVTETVLGDTLEELLDGRSRRLPARDLVYLGLHLTSALHALHSAGIVHLDVRPANVISRGGAAVLIDLSIAREPGLVRAGYGTQGLMSPEQETGGWAGPAADVWGLGMTLYVAAVGGVPERDRRGGGPLVAPVRHSRRLPADLGRLVDECLAAQPEDRPGLPEVARRLQDLALRLDD